MQQKCLLHNFFCAQIKWHLPPYNRQKINSRLIRKFDADGSGKLEFDEFCALVYTVANSVDKETLRNELKEAFRLFDKEVSILFY
jgi:Ca2+-binding EF-hand superfamily protein